MKRFLLIPSCALLALGVLTSCQKEEKTAVELAEELTAELQKVTNYKSAEAAAPRVEAINKRFQNASVRVFSMGGNALVNSEAAAYSDAVCRLARQVGRIRASKPVASYDGEVVDVLLVRTVGANSVSSHDAAAQEQVDAGARFIFNDNDQNANNPPSFAECYGSTRLKAALDYVASIEEFPMTRFDKDEDRPEIPDSVNAEPDDEVSIPIPPDDRDAAAAAAEEGSGDSSDAESTDSGEGETSDDSSGEETTDSGDEGTTDDASGDEEPAADDDMSIDVSGGEEETTDDSTSDASGAEETTDDSSSDDSGDAGEDDGMLDIEI